MWTNRWGKRNIVCLKDIKNLVKIVSKNYGGSVKALLRDRKGNREFTIEEEN